MLLAPTFTHASSIPFEGDSLSLWWILPFVGLILSIAFVPLFANDFWHKHYGKVTLFWSLIFFIPVMIFYGRTTGLVVFTDTLISEYIPFILLLFTLFTLSGGIQITGHFAASPAFNSLLLIIGTLLASIMGTTGASMLLIRPLLIANQHRKHRTHLVIFFIFLVANIGGGLTPLGDPPLFLGFLAGVDFFWTLKNMFLPVLLMSSVLISLFYMIDRYFFYKEEIKISPIGHNKLTIKGKMNFILIGIVVLGIVISGFWNPNISFKVSHSVVKLENVFRDIIFITVCIISLKFTPIIIRDANKFNWEPIKEVAKIFFGIFLTITPVVLILQSGTHPLVKSLINFAHDSNGMPINTIYFWVTTSLSAFLDNAPTYLVFFQMAAGNQVDSAAYLMNVIPKTLLTISMATVFTGPLTYIANAPNFMIKSIAEQQKVKMPSFFGYTLISMGILVPLYIILNIVFLT